MRHFDYSSATTVDKTVQQLAQNEQMRPLAGGTDLLTLMKADIAAPTHLIDIKRLDEIPKGIIESEQGTTLGALTTLADIELSDYVQRRFPVLAQAAGLAATPQLRNMATIGGNLLQRPRCWYFRHANFHCWLKGGDECHARDGQNQQHAIFDISPCVAAYPSDPPAALMVLDAEVVLRGPTGERTLRLDEFFTPPRDDHRRENALAPDELLLSIRIPPLPHNTRSLYLKAMDRKVWAFALVGVAARLRLDGDRVAEARLVLSGVAPIPLRLHAVEQMLVGQMIDEATLSRIADEALAEAQPLEHNAYKVPIAKNLIRRTLQRLAAGETGNGHG